MRTSLFRNLRKYLVVTLAIFVISGCGSADVDISCSEYFAEAPSAYQEKAPGILHDPETDLLWFRCNLGQRYENGRCVGDAANKNFAATLSDIAEISKDTSPTRDQNLTPESRGPSGLSFSEVNWRMPTESEYDSLTDVPCHSPKIDVTMFLDVRNDTYYWSSTEGKNDTYACATRLKDGLRTCQTKKTTLNPTLLVANAD
jgi:hypothetical protein